MQWELALSWSYLVIGLGVFAVVFLQVFRFSPVIRDQKKLAA